RIEWFVGLVLLQVLVLNNIHLLGYATPFLYVYFILKLNSGISRNELMLWAFFLGLTVDIFSNTPGMNAAALVLLAFVRPTILQLFSPRDVFDDMEPSFKTMGVGSFIRYTIVCVILHHAALLTIESFSFFSLPVLLLKIVLSAGLTVLCIIAIEGIKK
ncbi:MAG: rod shape-determining protein MreD, partial [Bacteroidaceae bacterium]